MDDVTEDGGEKVLIDGRNLFGKDSEDEINVNAKGTDNCYRDITGLDRSRAMGFNSVESGCYKEIESVKKDFTYPNRNTYNFIHILYPTF